jgi:DNA-binding NtrC family response regulator
LNSEVEEMRRPAVLYLAERSAWSEALGAHFARRGLDLRCSGAPRNVQPAVREVCPSLLVAGGPGETAEQSLDLLEMLRGGKCELPAILLAESRSESILLRAMRLGVRDCFLLPFDPAEVAASAARLCRCAWGGGRAAEEEEALIGESAAMRDVRSFLRAAAPAESNVLISGETGTGKELAAEMVHRLSRRAGRPFICVNCAALPDALLESELFGCERGAYTGATSSRTGLLEAAEGGTVFLDEVGEMSALGQAKLLRALETRKLQRLGSTKTIPINVRVIAATNRDLDKLVDEGLFRKDLYYRLNVAHVRLPRLAERKEDIPALCWHYVGRFNRDFGKSVNGLSDEAMQSLLRHDWPGNVRELKNVLEASFLRVSSGVIEYQDLPEQFRQRTPNAQERSDAEVERMIEALSEVQWNCTKAAKKLRWSRMTLYRKMRKHHLMRPGGAAQEPQHGTADVTPL